ncbi:uncharacterized protein LOC133568410 isoform X2 [Nerophis ophidion]|uniref:uncharacterized protein LOC133568410 isoform X2 n=1 Tax=Nerophis ophidion TaxID=159077 RepID=UPI002ADF4CB1|nr:uncharacterized protein LOC133568410 isoform X2 [Nerophis ophidion]
MLKTDAEQSSVCGSLSTAPATHKAQPKTASAAPMEHGTTGPTQPGQPATGTPEPGLQCHPAGPAVGYRQTRPAEDKAREKQGTPRTLANKRPHPTWAKRRDAPPRGAQRLPAAGREDNPHPTSNRARHADTEGKSFRRFRGERIILYTIVPGDFVLIKNFRRKSWKQRRWLGPFQVLLVTHTAVKVEERPTWVHASHCKAISGPVAVAAAEE